MVKIRLSRSGVRKKPFYRIVAIDERKSTKGKFLDIVGNWHPLKKTLKVNKEILNKWIKVGAKITPAVGKLLEQKQDEGTS